MLQGFFVYEKFNPVHVKKPVFTNFTCFINGIENGSKLILIKSI